MSRIGLVSRIRIPNWVAIPVVCAVAAVGLVAALIWSAKNDSSNEPFGPPPPESVLPTDRFPQAPLAKGELLPDFESGGWVNGEPKQPGEGAVILTVVDVWADWCPVCRQTAPGLVEAHRRFAEDGVAFVSLTSLDRNKVESFAREYSIPWPCGYGASAESFAQLGVYSTERMSRLYHPGLPNFHTSHEITPTLFLIGKDGRVVWNDDQARPRHLKDAGGVLRELTEQIERQLSERTLTE